MIERTRRTGRRGLGVRAGLSALWMGAWLLSPRHAQTVAAQAPSVELEWEAPPECPDRSATLERLAAHLPAGVAAAAGIRVRARVARDASGYRLQLRLQSPEGVAERSLASPSCAPLAEAAAVLIALSIQSSPTPDTSASGASPVAEQPRTSQRASGDRQRTPGATEPRDQPRQTLPLRDRSPQQTPHTDRQAGEPSPGATAAQSHTRSPAARRTPRGSEPRPADDHAAANPDSTPLRLDLQLTAAARLSFGMLPRSPSLGIQLRVGLQLDRARTALGVTYWLPAQAKSAAYATAMLKGSAVLADASAGVAFDLAFLQVTPSLAVEAGRLSAEALAVEGPRTSAVAWFAAGLALELTCKPIGRLSLGLDVQGLSPVLKPRWLLRTPSGDVPAFTTSPVLGRAGLRIGYAFE